jgi:hypothetical protein
MREVRHFGRTFLVSACAPQARLQEFPRKPQAILKEMFQESCQETHE